MKKITLAIGIFCSTSFAFAQSQRLVLYEEFTGENCGPCASTNPGLNALLEANSTKIIAIKYQSPIPSAPPAGSLYQQNPSEVDSRIAYYNVPFAPYGRYDGLVDPDPIPAAPDNSGHPGYWTQSDIDNEYAVPSPFTISIAHTYSPNEDSVYITGNVTASQVFSSTGALKLHLVMIEREIHLPAAIGTNGEKDFTDVMRKMIPTVNGTTLTATWSNGQIYAINAKAKIPAYVYDKSQIAIVAFVEDDGTKTVKQAALSLPLPLSFDAKLTANSLDTYVCTYSFSPSVTLENNGSNTLTSVDITYKIDNGTPTNYNWTGSLATGASAVVNLPTVSIPAGSLHTLTLSIAPSVNSGAGTDNNTANHRIKSAFYTATSTMPNEGFNPYNSAALPAGYTVYNPDESLTWYKTYITSPNNGIVYIPGWYYLNAVGQIDELNMSILDMSSLTGNQYLHFSVAYASISSNNDMLDVLVSTDCGSNWTNIYSKSGANLATAPEAATSQFVPTAAQWRSEDINITNYVGQPNVLIKFSATNDNGNNMYLDNISITSSPTSVENTDGLEKSFTVYPNPFTEKTTVEFNLEETQNIQTVIYNLLGEVVYASNNGVMGAGIHKMEINVGNLSSGIYTVKLIAGDNSVTQKVVIQ